MRYAALALILGLGGAVAPADGAWKAGVAKVSITPTESIWMAGFGSRNKPSEGVRQDLYAKALALQDDSGKPAVIVSLDLAAIEREMADAIADRCRERYGLSRERLMFNVSHTHSGPVAGLVLLPLYELTPEQREVIRRYTVGFIDKTVDVVGTAIGNLAPATVEFGQGFAGIAVNRRRVARRELPGPVDQDVPVLRVRDAAGSIRAIVAGYACHATALNDYQISGDWPGFAMEEIEKAHPGATALFIQGAGADSNALPRRTVELAKGYGRTLAAAVEEVMRGRMTPLSGPLVTALAHVDLPFQTVPTREELQARLKDGNIYRQRQARRLLEVAAQEGKVPVSYPYPVQVWRFGPELKLIALAGELVADYSLRLKGLHGWNDTWVAGYSNDVPAYIPSRRVLQEGGYEGGEAMIYFGRPAPFDGSVEDLIVDEVAKLVKRTAVKP